MSEGRKMIVEKVMATIKVMRAREINMFEKQIYNNFIYEICSTYGCSRRTAIEYIQTALRQLDMLSAERA